MNPIERSWELYEAPFNPGKLHHTETIYTVGNGYMGVRASFEEGYPGELASTIVHGVYDHAAGQLVPELIVLPNPLSLGITINGEVFNMQAGKVLGYRHALNMKSGLLTREILWSNGHGAVVTIKFERFASLAREHLLVQRIRIRALTGQTEIRARAWVDGTATNEGVQHWKEQTPLIDGARFGLYNVAGQSGYGVTVLSELRAMKGAQESIENGDATRPAVQFVVSVEREEEVVFERYTAIHSTRDAADPTAAARRSLDTAVTLGFDALLIEQKQAWDTYWHSSDVVIEGDELAQRAIRFCTYHILIAAPRDDERVSIGAKTLSGPGYKGHVFWDTELFMVPLLTLTQPKIARNLLMYRYHTLQGARNKAKEAGYEGAMYAWESTDTGEETTPRWTNPLPDGSRIRIWTGDTEQHISTDVAYAVLQYWKWTDDEEFFVNYGAEIFLDTAVFWGTRAEWKPEHDRYELPMQIGPDEYHENINNSVFTNSVARWHLRSALDVLSWLETHFPMQSTALRERLHITPERLDKWRDIIAKMYIPQDPGLGVLEQFDGFFNLKPINLAYWKPKTTNIDAIIGHEEIQSVKAIKQADVVMLTALLPEAVGDYAARLRNWQYYYPLVDHGSSLSPTMHAWVAARLGLTDEAYDLFMHGGTIDLEDNKGNVRDGIHAAAAGGLWQALVFGFAGLHLDGDTFALDPHLPPYWKTVQFRIVHRGVQKTIKLTNEA